MKLVFYISYLFFLYPSICFAGIDSINKKVEIVRDKIKEVEAIPLVQEIKKAVTIITDENTGILSSMPTDTEVKMDVCVECTDIIKLTESVNKIIGKMTENNPDSYLGLELGNLEAITYISKFVNQDMNQLQCVTEINSKLSTEFINIDKEELRPIFHTSSDLKFSSIQFKNVNEEKTIWLRGIDQDIDKVIKVKINKYGQVSITYYKIENIKPLKNPIYIGFKDNLPNLGNNSLEKKENLTSLSTGDLSWSENIDIYKSKEAQITAKIGSNLEYEYFIPTRVTLVDFEATLRAGKTDISSNIEIANDVQQATFKVKQNQFSASAKMNMEKEFEVGAGAQINIIDGLALDTYTTYNSNSSIAIDSKVLYDDKPLFTSKYERDAQGSQKYSISKEKKIDSMTTFSVKVERTLSTSVSEANNGNAVWLNFSKKF